jgi:hypothetical protein
VTAANRRYRDCVLRGRRKDAALARGVAGDLARYLAECASSLSGVYAFALWTDDVNADFLVYIATEAGFEHRRATPALADVPLDRVTAPAGIRWNCGDWAVPGTSFISAATERAHEPLAKVLRQHPFGTSTEKEVLAIVQRWGAIGREVLELVDPIALLPAAPDAIAYVEYPGTTPLENAASMTRTVPPDRMGRVFPHWRRLRDEILALGPAQLMELRALWAAVENRDLDVMTARTYVHLSAEATRALEDCGLWWADVARWSGKAASRVPEMGSNTSVGDRLALAVAIANSLD